MEELLPLIIGILWLVYTFYTKGQKKKSTRDSAPGERTGSKQSFLEQLLATDGLQVSPPEPEIYEDEFDYEPDEQAQPVPQPVKDKGYKSPFLDAELSGYAEEGQAQFKAAFSLDEEEDQEGYFQPSELNQQIGDFDLKKAVVFSAVLDAPYIDYK